jgi:radical SAM superfamily enzyme YgiQ (UPF0313 family)
MLGIDSGSDAILKNLKKNFNRNMVLETANLLVEYEIPYFVTVLLGGPGENKYTVKESFGFFQSLPQVKSVLINYGLRVMRDTELETLVKEEGLIASDDDLLEAKFYLSDGFDRNVFDLVYDTCKKNRTWMTYSRIDRILIKLALGLSSKLIPRPQWVHASLLARIVAPIKYILSLFIGDYVFDEIENNPHVVFGQH